MRNKCNLSEGICLEEKKFVLLQFTGKNLLHLLSERKDWLSFSSQCVCVKNRRNKRLERRKEKNTLSSQCLPFEWMFDVTERREKKKEKK